MKAKTNVKGGSVRIGLLVVLTSLVWLTFHATRMAEANYPVQDRRFRIHQYWVCIDRDGQSHVGCGFDCAIPGDECWGPIGYCFCPCVQE